MGKTEIKTLNTASKSEEEGRGNKIVKDEIFWNTDLQGFFREKKTHLRLELNE